MALVTQSIDVHVPVAMAYNRWTQFEDFPRFMDGVKEVRQLDDMTLEWTAEIGGQDESWTAEITEQVPDERIAWHAIGGKHNSGAVDFHFVDPQTTRITLQMEWEPEGVIQQAGAAIGSDGRQIQGDLERFKAFVESRGTSSGAWRDEISRSSDRT